MRIPLSRKVFGVFSSLFAVTAVLGLVVYAGLRELHRAAADVQVLQDFQLQVARLGTFNRGFDPSRPESREDLFRREFAEAERLAEHVGQLARELPGELRDRLYRLPTYLGYYEAAYRELFSRYATDNRRSDESLALLAQLAVRLEASSDASGQALGALLRVQLLCARVHTSRDLAALGELRRLEETAGQTGLPPALGTPLRTLVQGAEEGYVNYLGILDREAFLRDTGTRFTQVAEDTIQAIARESLGRQQQLRVAIGVLVLGALLLTFLLGHRVTRYLVRFLTDIRRAIESIRAGRYDYALEAVPEDEFGDLARFLRDLSGNLQETLTRLLASEERYKHLVENLAEWVWETDPEGRLTYASPVVEEMLGWRVSELLGKELPELLPPPEALRVAGPYEEALREQRPAGNVEAIFAHRQGGPVVVESAWQPVHGTGGAFLGLRGVSRDVSERRRAEEEKARLREQLLRAQKMEAIGTLSGGVAHDFNNLLQAITGYTELLLKTRATADPDYPRLKKIEAAAERASQLTRQLLLFSRRLESQPRCLDLNQEVVRALELLACTLPKMIEIRTTLAPELRPVWADPGQLEQVLVNLAVNARDAMPGGGCLSIETKNLRVEPGPEPGPEGLAAGDYVELRLADTGCGMDAATLEHIYEPFFTTKEVGKGTGLGLAMVYGIVTAHGGALGCESAPGEGSTFRLYLPALVGGAPAQDPPGPPGAAPGGTETVLLVDDEDLLRTLGSEILSEAGYTVLTAASGEAALVTMGARPQNIDLVVLDLNMPGMGGAECLRRLREQGFAGPALVASGLSPGGAELTALREAAQGFLSKPYRLRELLEAVRGALHPGSVPAAALSLLSRPPDPW